MHPLDLFDPESDFKENFDFQLKGIERASVPIGRKINLAEEALGIIAKDRDFISLETMSQKIVSEGIEDA